MPEQPRALLRVEPHQIPALSVAFEDAAKRISSELEQLRREGAFPAPWLGDPVSENIKAVYDGMALNDPRSTYQHLVAYPDELVRVYEGLRDMEERYRGNEADAAALMGPQA
jgi:hypothetical protein